MFHIATSSLPFINFGLTAIAVSVIYSIYQIVRTRVKTSKLRGPSSSSFLFGVSKDTEGTDDDPAFLYERWMDEYGAVYQIPELLGARRTVICDPKAIKHFNSMETFGYTQAPAMKRFIGFLVSFREHLTYLEIDQYFRSVRDYFGRTARVIEGIRVLSHS